MDERWWQKEGDELAQACWEVATGLEEDQQWRAQLAHQVMQLLEERSIQSGTMVPDGGNQLAKPRRLNLTRNIVETAHAEITGRQKPIPKVQTSGGDWREKRRGKALGKYIEGVFRSPKGQYRDVWELAEDAWYDSCAQEFGVVKTFWADGAIQMERHFCWELFVDPLDAKYRSPRNLFHIYTMDEDIAIATFAEPLKGEDREEMKLAILGASEEEEPSESGGRRRATKQVKIVEAWRLKAGEEDGVHVFCIESKLLHSEPWRRKTFPFTRFVWSPNRTGWYGQGLAEMLMSQQEELDDTTEKFQERFRLCGSKRTYYIEDSIDERHLESNESEVFIPVRKGGEIPQERVPQILGEYEMAYYQTQKEEMYEVSGISEMRATSRKEPGVTAGVAIRTVNDIQSGRIAPKAKAYEGGIVDIGMQIIVCSREAAEAGEEVSAYLDREIEWSEVELPEKMVKIQVAPASSLPNDPAQRLQMTQELFDMQVISAEAFKELLQWTDLDGEMNLQTSQRRYIDKLIDSYLDADETQQMPFTAPDAHLIDPAGAMLQVAQAYFDALYDDAPEANLEMLRRYLKELGALVNARAASQAMAMQAQGAAPPGGQPPPEQAAM